MIFDFKGCLKANSQCDLNIRQTDIGTVVMVTELQENPGTSITNAAEMLFRQICEHYSLDPDSIIWIEHYSEGWMGEQDETFDLVWFKKKDEDSKVFLPRWKRITIDEARSLQDGTNPFDDIEVHAIETEVYSD